MKNLILTLFISLVVGNSAYAFPLSFARGFHVTAQPSKTRSPLLSLSATSTTPEADHADAEEKASVSVAEDILKEIHSKAYKFRVVVIGNGAILENTAVLGPHFASKVSPKTGEKIVTLASDDKAFEFHVKVGQVGTITFSEKERPQTMGGGMMRIIRFVKKEEIPMCSLILAEKETDDNDVKAWFDGLIEQYGSTVTI